MYEGKKMNEWVYWSNLMALVANVNRSEDQAPFNPIDFNLFPPPGALEERDRQKVEDSAMSVQDFVTANRESAKLQKFR